MQHDWIGVENRKRKFSFYGQKIWNSHDLREPNWFCIIAFWDAHISIQTIRCPDQMDPPRRKVLSPQRDPERRLRREAAILPPGRLFHPESRESWHWPKSNPSIGHKPWDGHRTVVQARRNMIKWCHRHLQVCWDSDRPVRLWWDR
jgi:hypothetical protein